MRSESHDVQSVSLRTALPTWIRVAALSFGGPAGQIAVMHRLVVEEQEWVSEERFLHAMSYCMLLPGPEAQQLATYLGWLLRGARGGFVAGCLFILPGFVSIFVLSVLYTELQDTPLIARLSYGLKPAVMAVVLAALDGSVAEPSSSRCIGSSRPLRSWPFFCSTYLFPSSSLSRPSPVT